MARLALNFLGGFAARSGTGVSLALPMRRGQALLAYLAIPPGQAHPREKLTALLWGELAREEARARLRHTLFMVRQSLGGSDFSGLRVEADSVTLDPDSVEVDAVEFERLARSRDRAALERAAALYRGDLLVGLSARENPFEDWLAAQRERLRELALETLARLLRHQTDAEERDAGVQTALRLLELDPLQEPAHRALMRLYLDLGRRGAALRQYQQCVAVLQRELGVEPDDDTKGVYREIVRAAGPTTRPHETASAETKASRRRAPGGPRVAPTSPLGDTPLIGRAAEMERLREASESAARGSGGAVIVSGEAGAGKSRLVAELAAEGARRGRLVLVGRSHSTERILPLSPWIDALREAPSGELGALAATLGKSTVGEIARLLPELGEPTPAPRVDVEGWRRLFDAVVEVLHRLSESRPLLLVLEDVHWADDMSIRLLAFVARRLGMWSVLAVATVREEEVDDAAVLRGMLRELATEPQVAHIQLGPLSMEDIGRLTGFLARHAEEDDRRQLAAQAWRTSQGNPLVAVETIRALRARPPGAPEARLPLPERVRDLVRERFGRLDAMARELLPLAAVVGRDFDFALLRHAAGLEEDAVAAGVEELVRRRVLHEVGERFDFTHDRIREVAASDVLGPRRRLLHRRVGEAIEHLHANDLDAHLAALALHFREGEVWDKAVAYLCRAAASAWQRSAFREGRDVAEQALRVLDVLPRTQAALEHVVDVRLTLYRCLFSLGTFDVAHQHLAAAEAAVAGLDDPRRRARLAIYLGESWRAEGDLDRAVIHGEDGLRLAAQLGDSLLDVEANFQLGVMRMVRGEFEASRACFEAAVERGAAWPLERRVGYPYFLCMTRLARLVTTLGDFATSRRWTLEAMKIADATEHPLTRADACFQLGHTMTEQGDVAGAIPLLERCQRIVDEHHLHVWHPLVPAYLGYVLARAGRRQEATALLAKVLEDANFSVSNAPRALSWARAAAALRELGDIAAARDAAERALAFARARGERLYEPEALLQLAAGDAHDQSPRRSRAEARYKEALVVAGSVGVRPVVAHCHAGLARLYAARGEVAAARGHRERAAAMYHEMKMHGWLAALDTTTAVPSSGSADM